MQQDLAKLFILALLGGAIVVIGGVAFAVIQIQQLRRQRLEFASIELVRSFYSAEFTRAFTFLFKLPDIASGKELRATHPDAEVHAMAVSTIIESMGVLVYRRILPIKVIEDLMSGTVTMLWAKLEPWVRDLRREQNQEQLHEWFEWLANQFAQRATQHPTEPAYRRHKAWKA